jgi:hypothetical protein
MWITNGTKRVLIHDGTFPYWRSLGWQADIDQDLVGDEDAAAQVEADRDTQIAALTPDDTAPAAIDDTAAAGASGRAARADHAHTGQKLTAIAAPTGGLTQDAEARAAINAIRAALTAHGITL